MPQSVALFTQTQALACHGCATAGPAKGVMKDDHQTVAKPLKAALGKQFPSKQESNLRILFEQKDEVQYGLRAKTWRDAESALERVEEFAEWAEKQYTLQYILPVWKDLRCRLAARRKLSQILGGSCYLSAKMFRPVWSSGSHRQSWQEIITARSELRLQPTE